MVLHILAIPTVSFAQQFQSLFDIDSSRDWGFDLFCRNDSTYFIRCTSFNYSVGHKYISWIKIAYDGKTVLETKRLVNRFADLYPGNPAQTKTNGAGYIAPVSLVYSHDTTFRATCGLVRYNYFGDTIFLRTYTDTSIYVESLSSCAVMPDGGYIAGGFRGILHPTRYPGLIVRTDSMGDTLWTHTYQKFTSQWSTINNLIPLPDGRTVVGAMSTQYIDEGPPYYYTYWHNTPWFFVLDSLGNILRDTLYGNEHLVLGPLNTFCGNLYQDAAGGYIHIGAFDSLINPDPSAYIDFPSYIAHLDTNFRITWLTHLQFDTLGHRQPVVVKQLRDSSYLIAGDFWDFTACGNSGWAAKISRSGTIVWDHVYRSSNDSTHCAYFRDAAELPNGNLVFVGSAMNDSLPAWHTNNDVWLVSTDSNGCEIPGCLIPPIDSSAAVRTITNNAARFTLYPNPTSGNLTVQAPSSGTFIICNLLKFYKGYFNTILVFAIFFLLYFY